MVFSSLTWLAMSVMQFGGTSAAPTSYDAVRADALLARAWRGRSEAILRICSDQTHVNRIRALDGNFSRAQQAYQQRFGEPWQGLSVVTEGRLGADYNIGVTSGVSSKRAIDRRCQSPAGFAGAIGEYQNGVTLALAELKG